MPLSPALMQLGEEEQEKGQSADAGQRAACDDGGAAATTNAPMLFGIEATAQAIPRSMHPWWMAVAALLPPTPAPPAAQWIRPPPQQAAVR